MSPRPAVQQLALSFLATSFFSHHPPKQCTNVFPSKPFHLYRLLSLVALSSLILYSYLYGPIRAPFAPWYGPFFSPPLPVGRFGGGLRRLWVGPPLRKFYLTECQLIVFYWPSFSNRHGQGKAKSRLHHLFMSYFTLHSLVIMLLISFLYWICRYSSWKEHCRCLIVIVPRSVPAELYAVWLAWTRCQKLDRTHELELHTTDGNEEASCCLQGQIHGSPTRQSNAVVFPLTNDSDRTPVYDKHFCDLGKHRNPFSAWGSTMDPAGELTTLPKTP